MMIGEDRSDGDEEHEAVAAAEEEAFVILVEEVLRC